MKVHTYYVGTFQNSASLEILTSMLFLNRVIGLYLSLSLLSRNA
jgi:hypothetical protein